MNNRSARRVFPTPVIVIFFTAVLAGVCHILFVLNAQFSDYFNQNIASVFRAVLAHATNWIPFSLAETLILTIPVLFVLGLIRCIRQATKGWYSVLRSVSVLFSIGAMIYVLFVFTFAAGYQATRLSTKMGMNEKPVSAEQLYETAQILADQAESTLDEIIFRYNNSSVMMYDYTELSAKLIDAYDRVCEEYPFIQKLSSRIKPVALSEPWTYTHISGVYTMFTGEANVNVNFPDYVIPFTAAHELAHQRGIAREDEANFVAFLVCTASDDPYIRYSGYLNMYEYVSSALYTASKSYYSEMRNSLDMRIRNEMIAYNKFFDKYRETVVSNVSEAVNNSYLLIQGTPGTKSYGMVVDLAVAYLLGSQNPGGSQ